MVAIRPVQASDLAAISALDARLTGSDKPDYWQEMLAPDRHFLVAETDKGTLAGFIAATIKGWKDVIADNKLGIAAAKKRDPLIDEALETERLQISLQTNVLTPYVKANGMGGVDPERFARSVKLVSEAFGLPAAPAPDKVFTDKYLPPKADRMVAP